MDKQNINKEAVPDFSCAASRDGAVKLLIEKFVKDAEEDKATALPKLMAAMTSWLGQAHVQGFVKGQASKKIIQ